MHIKSISGVEAKWVELSLGSISVVAVCVNCACLLCGFMSHDLVSSYNPDTCSKVIVHTKLSVLNIIIVNLNNE